LNFRRSSSFLKKAQSQISCKLNKNQKLGNYFWICNLFQFFICLNKINLWFIFVRISYFLFVLFDFLKMFVLWISLSWQPCLEWPAVLYPFSLISFWKYPFPEISKGVPKVPHFCREFGFLQNFNKRTFLYTLFDLRPFQYFSVKINVNLQKCEWDRMIFNVFLFMEFIVTYSALLL
jgi:hypothetical protein